MRINSLTFGTKTHYQMPATIEWEGPKRAQDLLIKQLTVSSIVQFERPLVDLNPNIFGTPGCDVVQFTVTTDDDDDKKKKKAFAAEEDPLLTQLLNFATAIPKLAIRGQLNKPPKAPKESVKSRYS